MYRLDVRPTLRTVAVAALVVNALTFLFDIFAIEPTGWYLAALYTMFGYAFVGMWLFSLNRRPELWIGVACRKETH
jgi:hypothetical protein